MGVLKSVWVVEIRAMNGEWSPWKVYETRESARYSAKEARRIHDPRNKVRIRQYWP
jgi:hypothetical protein